MEPQPATPVHPARTEDPRPPLHVLADVLNATRMSDVALLIERQANALAPGSHPRAVWWVHGLDDLHRRDGRDPTITDRVCVQRAIAPAPDPSPADPPAHALLLASPDRLSGAVLILDTPAPPVLLDWTAQARPYLDNALGKARLQASVDRLARAEKLQRALYSIADMASAGLDMPAMLRGLHEIVGGLMYAPNFFIALYDEDEDALRFAYFADSHEEQWHAPDAVEPMESIRDSLTWHLIRGARPLMGTTEDLHRQVDGPLSIIGPPAADWLGVPMVGHGKVRGAMVVQSYDEPDLYTHEDQALLAFVGTHILTALDRKRAQEALERRTAELAEQIRKSARIEKQLKHEVLHDSLTGLPNRNYLREQLGRALARRKRDPSMQFAVLFLDLDRFKRINDGEGHLVGDALLREVAARFVTGARGTDMVARLGGDEFAILMDRIEDPAAATHLAHRLIDALSEPVVVNGRALRTGVSIGIALSDARHVVPDDMLRDADQAMYAAKADGRGQVAVFKPGLAGGGIPQRACDLDDTAPHAG